MKVRSLLLSICLAFISSGVFGDSISAKMTFISTNARSVYSAKGGVIPEKFQNQDWLACTEDSTDVNIKIKLNVSEGLFGLGGSNNVENSTSATISFVPGVEKVEGFSLAKLEKIGDTIFLVQNYNITYPKETKKSDGTTETSVEKSSSNHRLELEIVTGTWADYVAGNSIILRLSKKGVEQLKEVVGAKANESANMKLSSNGTSASSSTTIETLHSSKSEDKLSRGQIIASKEKIEYEENSNEG